jgi:hypothetical protein
MMEFPEERSSQQYEFYDEYQLNRIITLPLGLYVTSPVSPILSRAPFYGEVQQCPENLVTCAWAYLRLRGTVATVDQQIRLQLFSPPKQRDA